MVLMYRMLFVLFVYWVTKINQHRVGYSQCFLIVHGNEEKNLPFACKDKCNKVRSEELCVGISGKMESYGRGILWENPCRPIPVGFCERKQEKNIKVADGKGKKYIFLQNPVGVGLKKKKKPILSRPLIGSHCFKKKQLDYFPIDYFATYLFLCSMENQRCFEWQYPFQPNKVITLIPSLHSDQYEEWKKNKQANYEMHKNSVNMQPWPQRMLS